MSVKKEDKNINTNKPYSAVVSQKFKQGPNAESAEIFNVSNTGGGTKTAAKNAAHNELANVQSKQIKEIIK